MNDQVMLLIVGAVALAVMALLFVALRARRRRDLEGLEEPEVKEAPRPEAEAPPEAEAAPVAEAAERIEPVEKPRVPEGKSFRDGLLKTREQGFISRLGRLFTGKPLDQDMLQEVEEVLLTSDIGVHTATRLIQDLEKGLGRGEKQEPEKVWRFLRERTEEVFADSVANDDAPRSYKPHVTLVAGVNGTGKTTSIGKLAWRHAQEGRSVFLIAADTFRAAAVDQLKIWADRTGAGFYQGKDGADPASVVFEGLARGEAAGADVIFIDTAGRLHTKVNLVEELKKVHRVTGKVIPDAPHETLLVLDGTTGQNAIQQAKSFRDAIDIGGIVLTKLDGTAKGGVVIGIADELKIPIRYIGIGERLEDLRPFDAAEFVSALFPAD